MSVDPPPTNPGTPAPTPPPVHGPVSGYPATPAHSAPPGAPAGWPPPPPYSPNPAARKLPPKKIWYIIAAVLVGVGIVACGSGIAMVLRANGAQPSAEHTFRTGGSTTLHIDAGETKVIYVANANAAGGHHIDCGITGAQRADVDLKRYPGSLTLNQWDATFTVTPARSDNYTIRCTGAPSDTFGVGNQLATATMVGGLLTSIAGTLVLIVGLSVLTAALVLRRRRRRAQNAFADVPSYPGPAPPPVT